MEYVEGVYPYAEVHKLMSKRFWLVSFDELVGDRNLRRIVAHRNLACTGVELALSWLCWYEGNIFVDLQCAVADLRYAHPWRVTSLVLAMVCEFPDVCVSDLEYVRIGSRLLERIESEYNIGKNRDVGVDDSDDDSDVGAIYLDLSDVRYLWNQSKSGGSTGRSSVVRFDILSGVGSYRRFVTVLMLLGFCGHIDGALGGNLGTDQWVEGCRLGRLYQIVWAIECDLSGVGVDSSMRMGDMCCELLFGCNDDRVEEYYQWKYGENDVKADVAGKYGGESAECEQSEPSQADYLYLGLYISLFCGTQSDREEAESAGYFYIGLDVEPEVYSSVLRKWVKCVQCDVDILDADSLDQLCRGYLDTHGMVGLSYVICHVGASPVCKSFSRADSMNRTKGHSYRDHSHPDRPPLSVAKGGSVAKYKKAVAADKSMRHLIGLLLSVCGRYAGCTYHIENPFGSLQCRPYMLELMGIPLLVDYCAYGHIYMKSTNIWTNIEWIPMGSTGCGRCCNGKCRMGPYKSKGRFRHWYALGQSSAREKAGKGRKARRIMVPRLMHREMILSK